MFAPGYAGIVFTQLPVSPSQVRQEQASRLLSAEGARLVLLHKDARLVVLTPQFHSAADPAVSFDGNKILFAGKKSVADLWNIFEMNADGTALRQITQQVGNCRKPLYQPAVFYLNDPQPSYQITFVSDADGEFEESGSHLAENLYSVSMDGTALRRLTYGVSGSYDPAQMPDGRIVFSHWQRNPDAPTSGRADLFGVSLDGTDFAAFSGPQGKPIKRMATATTNRTVIFVESENSTREGGSLGMLEMRRNLHSYRALTAPADGHFLSPAALPDGSILVSNRPAIRKTSYSIYRLDPATRKRTLVFADAHYNNVQAVPLVAQTEPDGHSSVVEDDKQWSKLYCLSAHQSDLGDKWPARTEGWRVRILEALPNKGSSAGTDSASGLVQARILGETGLDEDGSFQVTIPPNLPVQVQLLDNTGMAVRSSAWIWTKNKENRGCIGCHEDGELTSENVFAQALSHSAAQLTLPPERRRTVDFQRDIVPILVAKCGSCHDANRSPRFRPSSNAPRTIFNEVYRPLFKSDVTNRASHRLYIDPGRSRTSLLAWSIMGKNTSRPWDCVAPVPVKQMPPPGSAPLTDEEREAIFEWIDLGAQFNPLPTIPTASTAGGSNGGQR